MVIYPATLLVIAIILWFIASVIISTGAHYRGHSAALFFVISIFLSPLVGAGFLWAMGSMDRDTNLEAILSELKDIKEKLA